ncbi:MAG: hypothetical protein JXR49_05745 [Acidobacteria bacterium]|nr:hypothetical protein [Acidobacteriota bacterium]
MALACPAKAGLGIGIGIGIDHKVENLFFKRTGGSLTPTANPVPIPTRP